jgi:hypothetical protein
VLESFCRRQGNTPRRVGEADTQQLDQRARVDHPAEVFRR